MSKKQGFTTSSTERISVGLYALEVFCHIT